MKKRALPLLLALVMVIALLPVTVQAGELENGIWYEVYGDHVEITNYYGSYGDTAEIVIPARIEGLPVTVIQSYAFDNNDNLKSVSIPDSITSIGKYVFNNCSNLTGIYVDENNAYYSSDNRGVLYDKAKTELIQAPCAITGSYTVPDSVTSIGVFAFNSCSGLTSVFIPDSVTSIGESAFSGCTSLTGIHVDGNNPYYCSDSWGVLFNKAKSELIQAPGAIEGSYAVPDSVRYIGDEAFYSCFRLISVSIPDGVIDIGNNTFFCCINLTGIHVDENNYFYASDDRGVLFDKAKIRLLQAPGAIAGTYTIPDGVVSIRADAFQFCSNLTGISIPNSVTGMGEDAFANCSSLTSISIPDSVTFIHHLAFSLCGSLTSIYFKGNAPEFGWDVFFGVTATAYYPADDATWTEEVMHDHSGNITWVPYDPNRPFTDVPVDSFYEEPVLWALENGITNGATETTFNPNGSCLRAQVVTFLHRAAGNPQPTATGNPFSDVKSSDFFYKPVLWAVEEGITNGVSADKFGSYDVCNRAAVVTFLWRAAGSPEPTSTNNPFTDVNPTDFFYKPVLWAIENGITNGVDATHFGPTTPCNRAQVVTFLYRAYH